MIRNSLFISATRSVLVLFGLMNRLNFLGRIEEGSLPPLWREHGALFSRILGLNLFAAALAINRKILLKDTGRKLSHFDNQLQAVSTRTSLASLGERR